MRERNTETETSVIYAVEDKAKEIDQKLQATEMKQLQHVSFKLAPSQFRLASMQSNEWISTKSRFEILFNANKNEIVVKNRYQKALYQCIMKQEIGNAGKVSEDAVAVIKLAMRFKVRKWIAEKYSLLMFQDERENKTSISTEEFENNAKQNEDLKILNPILSQKGVGKPVWKNKI